MPPFLPEHLHDQLGGAVDHLGMVEETGRGVDKAIQAQALDNAVEIAKRGLCLGENVEGAQPSALLALGKIKAGPERAGYGELPILERQLARHEELAVQVHE